MKMNENLESPCNLEAEQALLGALLVYNDGYARIADIIQAKHFFEPLHQRIFSAITDTISLKKIANPITLKPFFENDPAIIDIGDKDYLKKLASYSTGAILLIDYAYAVYDLAIRRELIKINNDSIVAVKGMQIGGLEAHIEHLEGQIGSLKIDPQSQLTHLGSSLNSVLDTFLATRSGETADATLSTGFSTVDSVIGGLNKPDLIILGGRTGMGKTAFGTAIAFNVAGNIQSGVENNDSSNGKNVALFSLEMSANQITMRLIANQIRVSTYDILKGNLADHQLRAFYLAKERLEQRKLFIDDTSNLSIRDIRHRCLRLQKKLESKKEKLNLIVIDYLQLINCKTENKNYNRNNEIGDASALLKGLAKDFDVPVIALSQLSRDVERRDNKRPKLADLRDSGSIEQDADIVMFVYRDSYYNESADPNSAEILVEKNRSGACGTAFVRFEKKYTRFY